MLKFFHHFEKAFQNYMTYLHSLQVSLHKLFINYKRKTSNYLVVKKTTT